MKKFFKMLITTIMIITLVCLSAFSGFAAVNGKDAPVGSTVEYTISIADCVQNITGIHLEILFDQTKLQVKEVNADNLSGSTTINDNQNNDGTIRVVNGLINGANGLECKEKTELVKVTFEVIAEGESEIKYYIPYLYDYDMVNLYKYTLSQTISVDGTVVAEDVPPVLANEEDFAGLSSFDKGDFKNYPEGTGSGIKEVVTEAPTNADNADTTGADNADNADTTGADNAGEKDNTVIIVIACAAVAVIAVIILVIVKSKTNK